MKAKIMLTHFFLIEYNLEFCHSPGVIPLKNKYQGNEQYET